MTRSDVDVTEAIRRSRQDNVVRLLLRAFQVLEARMLESMRALGHAEVRAVHLTLLRNIDLEGTRITDIADRAQLTKQAIGQLAKQCEAAGYVRRLPDPDDGRASILTFTEKGRALISGFSGLLGALDGDLGALVGRHRQRMLRTSLSLLLRDPGAPPPARRPRPRRQGSADPNHPSGDDRP
ncbi:MAG TPA: MarR family transcriptional regulator [Azospirillaceae bacterium]|nr:MarR family transcriptional regulator [Azospirillaceae bacterium]